MEKQEIKVEMGGGGPASITYTQTIVGFRYFGRELKISPKSNACLNKEGLKMEFFEETVSVLVGIGKDHSADLIMTKSAWDAFVNGGDISIDTVNEFESRYIRKRRVKKDNSPGQAL